jgi:hypothetical protein
MRMVHNATKGKSRHAFDFVTLSTGTVTTVFLILHVCILVSGFSRWWCYPIQQQPVLGRLSWVKCHYVAESNEATQTHAKVQS